MPRGVHLHRSGSSLRLRYFLKTIDRRWKDRCEPISGQPREWARPTRCSPTADNGPRPVSGSSLDGLSARAAGTRGQLGDLEVIPPRMITYRGSTFADFDVVTSIASGASLVLIDELAHATLGAARQRWEDVAEVLAAGIDVSTTANVANLRSLRDYAARLTGVGAVEYVPDEFVRSGEVVLVDMPPEALRRRISSGAVFSADQVGGALADYFRASNLEALSEFGASVDGWNCRSRGRRPPRPPRTATRTSAKACHRWGFWLGVG